MPRGGKRLGAGRPKSLTTIKKKVSLTLDVNEWKQIEESGAKTVAAFVKQLMKENEELKKRGSLISNGIKGILNSKGEIQINTLPTSRLEQKSVDMTWNLVLKNWESYDKENPQPTDLEILQAAYESLIHLFFPDGRELAKVETKPRYICPVTNKQFGSFDKLLRSLIPRLIYSETWKRNREKEGMEREKDEKETEANYQEFLERIGAKKKNT
jgi:hypothetical protein